MSKLIKLSTFAPALLPLVAFAQAPANVDKIVTTVGTTANLIIGVLFIFATLVFLWGLVRFIAKADDPGERAKSRGLMMWGIIGLAVMAAAWGITQLLVSYFGIGTAPPGFVKPPTYPAVQ